MITTRLGLAAISGRFRSRPSSAAHKIVHAGNGGFILRAEIPAHQHGYPNGGEISRTDRVNVILPPPARTMLKTFSCHGGSAERAGKWSQQGKARRGHARVRPGALQQSVVKDPEALPAIAHLAGLHIHQQNAVALKSCVDLAQVTQRPGEQPRPNQQNRRECHLRGHQHASPEPAPAGCRDALPAASPRPHWSGLRAKPAKARKSRR